MSQSRAMSLAEAITNVVAGFVLALMAQVLLFHAMGLAVTLPQNLGMTLLFSGLSLARGYVVRRLFNAVCPSHIQSEPPA